MDETKFHLDSAIKQFNQKLYDELDKNENGNIIFSPFRSHLSTYIFRLQNNVILFHSIHTAMSMVLIGSKVNSKSHSELAEALYSTENTELTQSVIEDFLMNYKQLLSYYKNSGSGNITLNLAYNAYLNEGFQIKEAYTEALKLFFDTGNCISTSFEKLRKSVNSFWSI